MKSHFKLSDSQFQEQFASTLLDPALFSHEAHLRLAYIHIDKFGLENAIAAICTQLLAYVQKLGAEDKYNMTLTVAAIKTVNHFMQKSTSSDFKGFIIEFPELKYGFKRLMRCHYGFDIFNSQKAKNTFLEPDLIPFD